jgi:hypothetical protein
MTRRVVLGQRANGDYGLFVSPPGIDAYTAPDEQLSLSASNRMAQLLQIGAIGGSTTVFLGLSIRPIVILFGTGNITGELPGYPGVQGVGRPAPLFAGDPQSYVDIAGDGSAMNVTCGARTIYAVYNRQY